jgi:uncharacterized protein (DUF697 family)
MSVISTEALAGIRLLICMAKADGVLKPEERFIIEDSLAGIKLPDGLSAEALLAENNDPALLAGLVRSAEARDYTYASAYAIACCDREMAEPEEKILAVLRETWGIAKSEEAGLERVLQPAKNREFSSHSVQEVADAFQREAAFKKMLSFRCVMCGITGAIPIPFVSDVLVVPMQMQLVHDIAALFGRKNDKATIQLLLETLLGGAFVRVGIAALCKAVPIWGSVVGATSSYASTYALGKVAYSYYRSEGKQSPDELKAQYRAEQQHGKAEYQKQKAALDHAQKTHGKALAQFAYDLQSGKITQEEYQQRIDALDA